MKKTLSITLGGRVYIVEEDAYAALERYVNKIRAQFKDDPNVDELVADMEAGMADVFEKQHGKQKDTVLTLADVEAMMAVMGAPEEIADEEPVTGAHTHKKEQKERDTTGTKRLYRNPDDVVVAGVCSGLAAYLGIDVVIVRIAFILFAFLNGVGILAYIIFWMAMPEAVTSAQKLEMRGKPVNLQEIEELVKEKAEKMSEEGKKAWSRMQDEKSPARRFLEVPVRFIGACARAIVMVASGILKVIGAVLGVALIIASTLAIAASTVAAAVMLFGIQSPYLQSDLPLNELIGNPQYYIGIVAAYFVVTIPLAFLVQIGSTFATRRSQLKTAGVITMTVIWFAALSTAAAMGTHLAPWAQARFAEAEASQTVTREIALSDDVTALLLSGNTHISITRGEVPSLTLKGREDAFAGVTTTIENGQLRLNVSRVEKPPSLCLFCHRRGVRAELVLPELTSVEARDNTHIQLEGFDGLALTAEDTAYVRASIEEADDLRVTQMDNTHVTLEGTAKGFTATLEDTAHLFANDLHAETVQVTVMDYSHARVRTNGALTATAHDAARITSRGNPATSTIQELDYGRVIDGYEQ